MDDRRLYLACTASSVNGTGEVVEIDTSTHAVLRRHPLPVPANGVRALDAGGGRLYIVTNPIGADSDPKLLAVDLDD